MIFEVGYKKDSFKYVNNYIIDEMSENWHSFKERDCDVYSKIIGLLHVNSSIVESIETILNFYQELVDKNYAELLKTEM